MNKFGNHTESGFGGDERILHLVRPGEQFGISAEGVGQGQENSCCTPDELPIDVEETKESLKSRTVLRSGELLNGGSVFLERSGAGGRNLVTQKLEVGGGEHTLLQVDCETMLPAEEEDVPEMSCMSRGVWRKNEDIVQIDETER